MKSYRVAILMILFFLTCFIGYSQTIPEEMINFYPFSGNAYDESVNGYHGIISGSVLTTDRCNIPQSAYYFDGNNDRIIIGDITDYDGSNALTISAWIYTDGITDEHSGTIISKYSTYGESERVFLLDLNRYHGDALRFIIYGADGGADWEQAIADEPIQHSIWNHVVVTWDGVSHDFDFYINGIPVTSTYLSNGNPPSRIYNKSSELMIGACETGYTSPDYMFTGSIDEVLTYNRVLTYEEILGLYYYSCENPDLIAYYSFNGNALDNSGNSNHGSNHGATLTTDRCNKEYSAYYFNGYSDYIELPSSLAFNTDNNFSIVAWFSNDIITSDGKYNDNAIYGQTDGLSGNDYPIILLEVKDDNTVRGAIRGITTPAVETRSGNVINNDQWYQVALVRNARKDSLSLYVNGELVTRSYGHLNGNTSSNKFVAIGAYIDDLQGLYHFMCGKIDDVMLFNRALSDGEIRELYDPDCYNSPSDTVFNIPNSFSPNGDNVNDLFIIRNLKENTHVEVFTRSGKKVYASDNYLNDWDGRDLDGNLLVTGTYWYVIKIMGFEAEFKGFLYIKR